MTQAQEAQGASRPGTLRDSKCRLRRREPEHPPKEENSSNTPECCRVFFLKRGYSYCKHGSADLS